MKFKFLAHFHVRCLCVFNGFHNRNAKLHFYNPYLEVLETDFEVESLYEFVVKFSNNIHIRFSFKMKFKCLTHIHVRFLCVFNSFQNRNPKLHFYNSTL